MKSLLNMNWSIPQYFNVKTNVDQNERTGILHLSVDSILVLL